MHDSQHSDPGIALGGAEVRQAFAVADELAVHGASCVCPRCAARLPGLLRQLAEAVDEVDRVAR